MRISLLTAALVLTLGGSAAFAGDPVAPATTPAPGATAPLKLADLPAAVKKTYEEKSDGAEPVSIEKVVHEGKTVYVIKFHGKKDKEKLREIKIGEDGKLLKKHDDKGDKDKKGDKEKGDKK